MRRSPAEGARDAAAGVRQWRSGAGDGPQGYGAVVGESARHGVSAFHSIHRGPVYAWSVRGCGGAAGGAMWAIDGRSMTLDILRRSPV